MSYLFLAMLGLRCSVWAFSALLGMGCGRQGPHFLVVCGLLTAVASLVAERGMWSISASVLQHAVQWLQHMVSRVHELQYLGHTGSVVVELGLSCSLACRIFLHQGSNPGSLHWQADSNPLCHQESPNV